MAKAAVAGTVTGVKDIENTNVNNGKENIQNTKGRVNMQNTNNLRENIQNTNVNNGIISEPGHHDVTEFDGSVRKFESDVPVLGNLCLGVLHMGEAAIGMDPTLSCEGLCALNKLKYTWMIHLHGFCGARCICKIINIQEFDL